jgi:hypothetical protein
MNGIALDRYARSSYKCVGIRLDADAMVEVLVAEATPANAMKAARQRHGCDECNER